MDHLELLYKPASIRSRGKLDGRLVVVSNRVPLPACLATPAAGGLAVALEAALKARGGLWFGWSGEACKENEPVPKFSTKGSLTYAVSDLSRRDIEQYYHGFANRALWPICHYRLDLADLSECNAAAYFRVNERFARQLHKMLRPDDIDLGARLSFRSHGESPARTRLRQPDRLFHAYPLAGAGSGERLARLSANPSLVWGI